MKKEERIILNKYLETYNKATDKVQVIATLTTVREGQVRDFKIISSGIDFDTKLDVDPLKDDFLKERILRLIFAVRTGTPFIDENKKGEFMSRSYEAAILECEGEYKKKMGYHAIENITDTCSEVHQISLHLSSLNAVIRAAILKGYPESLGKEEITPHNFAGQLSEECITDLQTFRKDNPQMPVNDFFKTAWFRFDSSRKSADDIPISWGTLKSRIKEIYPEIYKRKK